MFSTVTNIKSHEINAEEIKNKIKMSDEIKYTEIRKQGVDIPEIPEDEEQPSILQEDENPKIPEETEESAKSILEATEEKIRSGVRDIKKSMEGLEERLRKRKSEAGSEGYNGDENRRDSLGANEAKIQKAVENMDAAVEPGLIDKIVGPIVDKIDTAADYISDKIGIGKQG